MMTDYMYRVRYYSVYRERFGDKRYELVEDRWVTEENYFALREDPFVEDLMVLGKKKLICG